MTITQSLALEREIPFTADDFHRIAQIAHSEAGITMPDAKEPLVYARLVKRLRQLALSSFADYIDLLLEPDAADERAIFISTMTTNTTRFFREEHHFDLLHDRVLPPLIAAARKGKRVRLWSAGCSSGEEPYSMAITLLRLCPGAATLDIRILATDVDRQILDVAQRGRYPEQALASLPGDAQACFQPADNGLCEVADPLRALVSFKLLNLVRPWPVTGPFDVIFCRNVAIYFDAATQDGLWRGFASTLGAGGHLFIGHSERLSGAVKHDFEMIGMTTFRLRGSDRPGGSATGEDGWR